MGGAVFVLTVDQRASRRAADLVPALLGELNVRSRKDGLLRKFERTAGDEAQGVLDDAGATVDVVTELPRATRAGRGEAFVCAREAVTRAKSSPHHVNVVGADPYAAEQVETVLWLIALVLRRRSERGWEVADLLSAGMTRRDVGARLGVSQSAVSQRVQAAAVVEEQRARSLATRLLASGSGR